MQRHCDRQEIRKEIRNGLADDENGIPASGGQIHPDFTKVIFQLYAGRTFRQFILLSTAGAAATQLYRLILRSFSGQCRETWAKRISIT